MSITRRLPLLVALALAAMAVAANAASATTVAPTDPTTGLGNLVANSTNATLGAGFGSVVCTSSTANIRYQTGGAGHITGLTFTSCQLAFFGTACTVDDDETDQGTDVTSAGTIVHNAAGPQTGDLTLGASATITALVTCGTNTCNVNADNTNGGTLVNGDPAQFTAATALTIEAGSTCTTADWTADYTVDTVDAGTGTPTPDDTRLTVEA